MKNLFFILLISSIPTLGWATTGTLNLTSDTTLIEDHNGTWQGSSVEEIIGRDLTSLIAGSGDNLRSDTDFIGYELGGNSALFKGDYKIVFNRAPLGDNTWHLFNISIDPGESRDLATVEPERLGAMLTDYENYVIDNNVLPIPEDYNQVRQIFLNSRQ